MRRRFMGYFTEKALEGMTDVLVTVNSEDFETAQRCFKKPAIERLHGIGVDTERFCACRLSLHERSELRTELGVPPEAALLVYVAEINANKNQGMLLETLRCMKKKGRKANLLLVGPEHDGGTLRRNILAGGLEDSVVLCGWREDVPRLLQAADVYLASSLSEGLPINILEAMVSGLPVVAAENRGHSELIRHGKNGFLVKKNDHVSMAEYVMKLLDEPQTAARLSVQAQKDAESYSLEYVLREEYELIDKYIG